MKKNRMFGFCLIQMILLAFGFTLTGAPSPASRLDLNGDWELSFWPQPAHAVTDPAVLKTMEVKTIPAKVPGNVELDLLAAGLINDPMVGNYVNDLRPYEGFQWCYTRKFASPKLEPGQKAELALDGVDCFADIWINGKHVASTDNMLVEHAFDVTGYLAKEGENTLQVIFRSSVIEGQNHLFGTFSIGNFPSEESVFVRKAPHGYGWDIMPRLVSAGLWKDVNLNVVNAAHLTDVHWMTAKVDLINQQALVYVDFQTRLPFDQLDKAKIAFTLSRDGKEVYRGEQALFTYAGRHIINLQNAAFWWPRGYGDPTLYDAKTELIGADGRVMSADNRKIGLRTVQLALSDINLPDKRGDFCFIVNGEKIFVRGTNWVPLDALHSRDAALLDDAMKLVTDLNCNMIRCWGGNVYESDRFYDLCDRNGIMVWQDFVMGCTFYPQREEFTQAIEKEVISVVKRLRSHPSLALWAGNNEDDIALRWSLVHFNQNPNLDAVTRRVIPAVLYEFDPTRPYLPSSPYISQAVYEKGSGDDFLPENHLWGPRGYYKDKFYTDAACTFVSEIGYHGCPNRSSLEKMMTKESVYPWTEGRQWNDQWITKSVRRFPVWGRTVDRNNLMINQVNILFGSVPDNLDDFIFASQAVQGEAMKYFVEMWRGRKFERTGIIWWNVRDGWPVISDAVVDYYNSKKLAYYFLQNVQENVCLFMTDAQDGAHPLIAVNDTREAAHGDVTVTDLTTGREIFKGSYTVPANGRQVVAHLPQPEGQGMLLIRYGNQKENHQNHYLYGKPPYDLKTYKTWLDKTKMFAGRDH